MLTVSPPPTLFTKSMGLGIDFSVLTTPRRRRAMSYDLERLQRVIVAWAVQGSGATLKTLSFCILALESSSGRYFPSFWPPFSSARTFRSYAAKFATQSMAKQRAFISWKSRWSLQLGSLRVLRGLRRAVSRRNSGFGPQTAPAPLQGRGAAQIAAGIPGLVKWQRKTVDN